MQLWELIICKNVNNAAVSAKTNKTFTRSARWIHMVRSSRHATHRHRQMHKVAIHNFPPHPVDVGENLLRSSRTFRRARQRQQSQKVWRWKEGQQWEQERKSRRGMEGKKLVISLSCKVVRGGDQWEWAGLQEQSGLSARWERRGWGSRGGWVGAAGPTCLLLTALSFPWLPHFYGTTHK